MNNMDYEYQDFIKKIYKFSGINLSLYKQKQMKRRLDSLILRKNIKSYSEYYDSIINNKNEYKEFINYITINVSEFFRNPSQWKVLKDLIIPNMNNYKKGLKIWSAACSTGEEVYTIAIILKELGIYHNSMIISTDIDNQALNKAMQGIYDIKSVKNVPDIYLKKYFIKQSDKLYMIKNDLKTNIDFKQLNLLKDNYPKKLDLIICRNVLIYFTENAKHEIYIKFNNCLNESGILFVGSTEQIIFANKYKFKPIRSFFYKKI